MIGNDDDVFEQVAIWKADAALELGLEGEARCAAVSPGPAFPAVLRTLVDAVPRRAIGPTLVDLGAGSGGAGVWLAGRMRARLIAIEPAEGSRVAAHRLFPHLDMRAGTAENSGLADATADMVVALGVTSLLDDISGFVTEARRLLRPGGVLGIADMFLADSDLETSGINTLRSLELTIEQLHRQHFETAVVGCANDATPHDSWSRIAATVKQRVSERHATDAALGPWLADQDQLDRWVSTGHVFGACVVCTPTNGLPSAGCSSHHAPKTATSFRSDDAPPTGGGRTRRSLDSGNALLVRPLCQP